MNKTYYLASSFIIFMILIAGCSVKKGYPYPEDLPEKEGFIIIIIHSDNEVMERPEFLSDYIDRDTFKIIQVDFSKIKGIYPLLKVEEAPYYLFLNYQGIAFETKKIEAAKWFYDSNVNAKMSRVFLAQHQNMYLTPFNT